MSNTAIAYTQLIDPKTYDMILSDQHIYVAESERYSCQMINNLLQEKSHCEIIDIGCGPGRMLKKLAACLDTQKYCLTGIDIDENFVRYAKMNVKDLRITIANKDIIDYKHPKPVTLFLSGGVHHHIQKGEASQTYLANIYQQLEPGAYYLLSDEFLPNYHNNNEREINLIIWYSHVIAHAQRNNFDYLATEEAHICMDDIFEGRDSIHYKTLQQIKLILDSATAINNASLTNSQTDERTLAVQLLAELNSAIAARPSMHSIDFSREDFKICDAVFRQEIEPIGFEVIQSKSFGDIELIGGMTVYLLQKPLTASS